MVKISLLDTLTGGKSDEAGDALKRAESYFGNLKTPTLDQLTLPELQKYVQAGIMTPAEAQAALQKSNAYNDIKVDPVSREAQIKALNELGDVSDQGGLTDEMKAQLTESLDKVGTENRGHDAYILDQMAQRGIPTSLMGTAASLSQAGEGARNANLTATQAAGEAERNAVEAMLNSGNLASTMHGEDYSEAANRAAAENAMQQWNAQATNTANLTNAGYKQAANAYNTENKQNVSNQNTATTNYRTGYNAQLPEQMFQDEMSKANGMSGAATNYGSLIQKQGDQNAAINLGAINMGLKGVQAMAGVPPTPSSAGATPGSSTQTNGNETSYFDAGGTVPGKPVVPGDSLRNDRVPAMLSPGEIVVPRTQAQNPEMARRFVTHLIKNPVKPVHHEDVKSVLDALTARRG